MPRIAETFSRLREKREGALVLFVTAGDPSLAELPAILNALAEGGADLIEVGIPFSDPIADGPVIQASSQRALDSGVTFKAVLEAVRGFDRVPLVAMGYLNTFLRHRLNSAASQLSDAGFSGTIVSDLIYEESEPWRDASRAAGLDTVMLAAPTSTDDRLDGVCAASSGFVYAVSRTGVTGSGSEVPQQVSDLVDRVKARTALPVCVGFGVSKPDHVRAVCRTADGAVIGSWLVEKLSQEWQGGRGRDSLIGSLKALKAATRGQ